jgi:hypothetical protein
VGRNKTRDGLKTYTCLCEEKQPYKCHSNEYSTQILDTNSCLSMVKVFKRKLQKQMRVFANTVLIDVDLNADLFTRHGLHMNSNGKENG